MAKVGRSKEAHKVKTVINSIFFITTYIAQIEESQPGLNAIIMIG
jgi:hypothetical protein